MKRSILIVMLDVMVLSVLSLNIGKGSASSFLLPVYQWSSLIEQGIEKEKDYRDKIAELEHEKALAEERERLAKELAGQHKELQETTIEQLEKISQREQDAHAKMLEAEKLARDAELKARLAAEEQQRAQEEAKQALAQKKAAEKLAKKAEETARKAATQAQLAKEREAEIKERIAQMENQQLQLTEQQQKTQKQASQTEGELREKSGELAAVIKAQQEAFKREQDAMQKLQAERERAEKLLVAAELAKQEAEQAENRAKSSQQFIGRLRDRIESLQLDEQQARLALEEAEEDKKELSQKLEEIAEERNQSVWVQRDNAMIRCGITMVERDKASGEVQTYQEEIFAPAVTIGNESFLITDAEHLGLFWWQIQYDRNIVSLQFEAGAITTNASGKNISLTGPVLSLNEMPAVCLIGVNALSGTTPLRPTGMAFIKNERIQHALAFSPVTPDKSVHVEITPMLNKPYLTVKNRKNKSWFSRREVREGDYLLTESGRFIGIMMSKDLCYVIPENIPDKASAMRIPLVRDLKGNAPYDSFVNGARALRQRVKKTSLPDS